MMLIKPVKGFTLVEVLMTIGIVAALAAIALPTYLTYSRKASYSEIVLAVDKYRPGVATCISNNAGNSAPCDGGKQGVIADQTTPVGGVASITVVDGVITGVPTTANGFTAADTYVLTPNFSSQGVVWTGSGGACLKGYAECK